MNDLSWWQACILISVVMFWIIAFWWFWFWFGGFVPLPWKTFRRRK